VHAQALREAWREGAQAGQHLLRPRSPSRSGSNAVPLDRRPGDHGALNVVARLRRPPTPHRDRQYHPTAAARRPGRLARGGSHHLVRWNRRRLRPSRGAPVPPDRLSAAHRLVTTVPVAATRDVAVVAQAGHKLVPGVLSGRVPARFASGRAEQPGSDRLAGLSVGGSALPGVPRNLRPRCRY